MDEEQPPAQSLFERNANKVCDTPPNYFSLPRSNLVDTFSPQVTVTDLLMEDTMAKTGFLTFIQSVESVL